MNLGGSDLEPTIEARSPSGVARASIAADLDKSEEGVLIAIDPHFNEPLTLTRRIALAP